ncbi:MAG: sigma-70 family RNA polymerase sigma factor [Planctomycetota bacterium]|nr:sigma-70 family RNA polymerase sigma factor [Planctomycetota bacterium]
MDQLSDESPIDTLIEQAKRKDHAAWSELVERFEGPLSRSIRPHCRCDADADDFVQDAFLVAYERLDTLTSPAALWGWLFRIAWRKLLVFYRRERGRNFADGEEAEVVGRELSSFSSFQQEQLIKDVRDCIQGLDPDKAAAISLIKLSEMTYAEAAAILRVPPGTVSSRITHAMPQLRRCLESKGNGNVQ